MTARQRAGSAFGRLTHATTNQPVPVQNSDANDTHGASGANDVSGASSAAMDVGMRERPGPRPVVGRFTVRLYDARHAEAWTAVRGELARQLGRMPSASEVAEISARVLLDVEEAQTRATELLRRD